MLLTRSDVLGFIHASAQHDAVTAICSKMPYCSVKRPQNSRPRPDRGASVRNGEVELTSRGRGSSIWTTSGRFSVKSKKRHPLRDETSTDETTPKPDRPRPHLGRNRVLAYGPVTFPHSGVSRVSASVRLMIQGHRHSARRGTSRVRQCHQLIRISEIKSESYTRCDAK